MKKILVTGSVGQIGSELVPVLREKYGSKNVVATVHKTMPSQEFLKSGPYEKVDTNNKEELVNVLKKYNIDTVFHMVGILSAVGEKKPDLAWKVNMESLKHVLDLAKEMKLKVFWPSSIAAFGPNTPKKETPQLTIMDPNTMYGITKYSGELLCNYYFQKYGVDVRSVRYPGIISWKTPPGGGTTDYAVAVFYEALKNKKYTFFVKKDTILPMMYMPDAIKAAIDIMESPIEKIKIRLSYNLAAISFSAEELAKEVKKYIPDLKYDFIPDERQKIADSWPASIDDSNARKDWNWKHKYGLAEMTKDMISNLKRELRK
ncbi:MAG: NAD-dependent epimerase/dehydratase family protein [Nanoarchaeota archaeon]|nr:NAD-dependent epimerase/dehydratase family protein [Nanoarchaeota archaeon]